MASVFAKRFALSLAGVLIASFSTPVVAGESDTTKTVTLRDLENLDHAEQAAVVLKALASRATEVRAGGFGDGSNVRLSLISFSTRPSLHQTLCRKDRLLIWAEPIIGGPDERQQDDPPTQIERVDVQHFFAAHGLSGTITEDEKRQACLDGIETLNFFKAVNFEQARDALIILNNIKYRAADGDLPEEYECENQRRDEPDFCAEFARRLENFEPSTVEYHSKNRLLIYGRNSSGNLEIEVGGTIVRSLKLINAEQILVTSARAE